MRTSGQQQARARATAASGVARHRDALEAYARVVPLMRRMRARGRSFARIASELNATGHRTREGRVWNSMLVWRVLERAGG
jgi:hypothetical protein